MRYSKSDFLAVLSTVLIVIESAFYIQLQNNYDNLNSASEELKREFAGLQSHYKELNVSYDELKNQYEDLNDKYDYLKQSHDSLQRDYEIEKALSIGNSLESFYDFLREQKGFTGTKGWLYSDQREADFAAMLALHDLGSNCWPLIENEYYKEIGKHSYEEARKKIVKIIDLVGISPYDSETEKISKILDFMNSYISYESEANDLFLAPVETLGLKSGDCDDFSILAAALFKAVGIDAAFAIFQNENKKGHCMVLVHLEDLTGYHYSYYSDLTGIGLEKGRWIMIDPQYTIDNQGSDWIRQWNLVVAAPLINPSQ